MSGPRRDLRAGQRHRGARVAEKWTPGGRGCQKYGRLSREAAYFLDASRLWENMEGDAARRPHPRNVNAQVDDLLENGKTVTAAARARGRIGSAPPRAEGPRKRDAWRPRLSKIWTPQLRGCLFSRRLAALGEDGRRRQRRQHPRIVNTQVDGLPENGKQA